MSIPYSTYDYLMVEVRQNPNDYSNKILLAGRLQNAFTKFDFSTFATDADTYDFNG